MRGIISVHHFNTGEFFTQQIVQHFLGNIQDPVICLYAHRLEQVPMSNMFSSGNELFTDCLHRTVVLN